MGCVFIVVIWYFKQKLYGGEEGLWYQCLHWRFLVHI